MRQGCRQLRDRSVRGMPRRVLVCALAAMAAIASLGVAPDAAAQSSPPPALAPSTTPTGGAIPYWQAPALPTAVIQGGAIPAGWTPQPVPYQGIEIGRAHV